MAKKLFLHIGAQKTGTTSIQAVLKANSEALSDLGYCYPEVEMDDENKVSHYNSFRGFFSKHPGQRASTSQFIDRVSVVPMDLILSAECLSAWPPRPSGVKLHALRRRKSEIVCKIRDSFPNHDVKVILFKRNGPDFLRSLYGQYLKVTGRLDTAAEYDSFLSRESHLADFDSEISIWKTAFSDVEVVDYDAITSSVTAFCDVVGMPRLSDIRENVSA